MKKFFSNGEITIVWQANICIHSATCLKGLPSVFNNTQNPWINPHGASSEEIIKQVEACPTGALTWLRNSDFQKR